MSLYNTPCYFFTIKDVVLLYFTKILGILL